MILDSGKVTKMLYGGDYNPEQWDEETREKDMELLGKAHIDVVTLNVFNWAMLQPNEETYDFSELDETVERVTKNGMKICMATSTGAHPAWMAKKYPDILRTEFSGMKRKFGGRHNSCPNSPTFRKYSVALARALALHYKDQKNIVAWHVSNEYGEACYCENCEKAFRVWLRKRYGTLENLNYAWNTRFWGHTFYDWDEIVAPNLLSEHFEENRSMFQGITLDYKRFNSDGMLQNFRNEYQAIKEIIPDAKITTNFMGTYKPLDYKSWAPYLDMISWDNYPEKDAEPAKVAMNHDLMRGLKGGMPFMLMEQTPSVSNWLVDNGLKRPGVMRLQSYQAVAHGADTVMFFQMRRSPGACEKFHGAVIDHAGREDTRVFRECAALGKELEQLGGATLGTRTHAKAAILFDWPTWWALECSAGPSTRMKYLDEILNYYRAFYEMNISVDFVGTDDDISGYQFVAAPLCYMVKEGLDEKLRAYAKEGGSLLFTYMSGYVNESDYITVGGYPGKLKDMCGIWVEEIDALSVDESNSFVYNGVTYPAELLCDLLHCEGAEELASYQADFYQGMPVVTKNRFGKGTVYYVGTRSNPEFYRTLITDICKEQGISPVLENAHGLEITERENENQKYIFVLNHQKEKTGTIVLPWDATELLGQNVYKKQTEISVKPREVLIFQVDK